jgi:hypothetical protein
MQLPATAIFILLSLATTIVQAGRVPLGPNPMIGGVSVSCMGVPTWLDDEINDIAIAVPGAIVLSPALGNWPPVVQVFVYAHECAHHLPAIRSNENAADCWAIKLGRNQGWIDFQGLRLIQTYFQNNQGDWTHLPGRWRIQQMQACFSTP